jgi:multidrug efflux pump subunit AcrA (membrane-fusion protein)
MSISDSPETEKADDLVPMIRPSDRPVAKATKAGQFSASVLFNIVIPIALILLGVMAVKVLGVATAPPRDVGDDSRAGRLQALAAVRVEQIESLQSTGEQLQLIVDGTVVPFHEARVAAEVAGRIVEKDPICEAGSIVKKGQLLMKIDPTDYELEVDRLTRQKEQAYQSLLELDQEKTNTARLVKVAKDDVDLQQSEVRRQESLPKGFASRGDIDRAKRSLLQAQQSLVANQNLLDLLDKRRVRLEASEKLAATQLKAAELNLERTNIIAPIDGVIVVENADANTFVNRGSVLLTIEDTSKVEVATNLRMDQLYWVLDQKRDASQSTNGSYDLPDTEATIQFDLPGRDDVSYRWNGRLLSYDGVGLDPQTRTVPVRVLVDDPQSVEKITQRTGGKPVQGASAPTALLRGMYVQVKLKIKPQTPLVVIPGTALQPGNRIWQFVPDETVLDKPANSNDGVAADGVAAPREKLSAATDAAKSESDSPRAEDKKTSNFVADDWTPGRVVVQRSVYPVDALTTKANGKPTSAELGTSSLAGERQFWVCEIKGDAFAAESYVETSPLSGVDSGGLLAREKIRTNDSQSIGDRESTTKPASDANGTANGSKQQKQASGDAS